MIMVAASLGLQVSADSTITRLRSNAAIAMTSFNSNRHVERDDWNWFEFRGGFQPTTRPSAREV